MAAPYSCQLKRGPNGRIEEKTETVAGRAATGPMPTTRRAA